MVVVVAVSQLYPHPRRRQYFKVFEADGTNCGVATEHIFAATEFANRQL